MIGRASGDTKESWVPDKGMKATKANSWLARAKLENERNLLTLFVRQFSSYLVHGLATGFAVFFFNDDPRSANN